MTQPEKNIVSTRRLRIIVTMETNTIGWELLAPNGVSDTGIEINGCQFSLNPPSKERADYWIVFANARPKESHICAPENTLFVAAEPLSKKTYPKQFYRQFYRIVDTHLESGHPRVKLDCPCLCWHVGYNSAKSRYGIGYQELSAMPRPSDTINKVSAICSDAAFTEGQRRRLRFLENLKKELGDNIIHYGRGFRPVDDKLSVIRKHRFHLAMENCQSPYYWTEKLSDSYLGWATPLYIGCENITDYFPGDSMHRLNIHDPVAAANKIRQLLSRPETNEESRALKTARDLALNRYNPWNAWARWARMFYTGSGSLKEVTIRSHKAYRPFPKGLIHRIRHSSRITALQ